MGVEPRFIEYELQVKKMTLKEMFPEWWCKATFSVPENCSGDYYNWLDFSIYEFIFTVVIVLVVKWITDCSLFIIGLIIPDRRVDATIISPSPLEKEMDIPNDEMEDRDSEFDEDVFSFEEESKKMSKSEEDFVENIDKEIETSIANITRKEVNK